MPGSLRYTSATGERITVLHDVTFSGTNTHSGATTISGTTTLSGATTVSGALTASGAVNLTGLAITDPGNVTKAIPVTKEGVCAMTSAGAETRTLAIPAHIGQSMVLVCDTYVGDIVVTVAAAVNVANNNTLTFGVVSDACELVGVSVGGALVWQIGWNDGVALSTV